MKVATCAVFVAMSIVLAGCAQSNTKPEVGHDFDSTNATKLIVGQCAEADVTQLLGKPQSRTLNPDGSAQLTYQFTKLRSSANAADASPDRAETQSLIINLDSNGKFSDYSQSGE